jgi:integrase
MSAADTAATLRSPIATAPVVAAMTLLVWQTSLKARWSDFDPDRGVLRVRQNRVLVGNTVATGSPKSEAGIRDVPLSPAAIRALNLTRERTLSGVVPLRQSGTKQGERLIAVDEEGQPLKPDQYSRKFARIIRAAGLPQVRLHDVRHAAATLLVESGVPPHVAARILGHDAAVLMRTYAHASRDAMTSGMEAFERAVSGPV